MASFAAALPVAGARGAVINFDDLTAPGKDSGTGLTVNIQYNGQGVTFSNASAFDYSKPTAIPGFAHSGTVAVESCAGAENCTPPLTATFTTPQRSVQVWVGYSIAHNSAVDVRMTAFDAESGGSVVAHQDATIAASPGGPSAIQTPILIDAPPARIRRIEVSLLPIGTAFNGALSVDDVEFSTVGPPPPCTATSAPTVTLLNPSYGTFVHNNEFLLQGSIDTRGAPITSASIVAVDEDGQTRTGPIFPSLVDGDGGQLGPVRINGLLFSPSPGTHDVSVTATNCKGTGTSDAKRVLWTPLPATTKFRQLNVIEVNQAVQTTFNSVPLIAATANGIKRTFARVYLHVEGGADSVSHVTGTLTAVRPDGTRPPGPLRVTSVDRSTYIPSGTLQDVRSRLTDSLYFELPPEWLTAGTLHLELEHLEIEGQQTPFPCEECANIGVTGPQLGQTGPAVVRFHRVPPLRIFLISMPYRPSPGATPVIVSQPEIDGVVSLLRRMYPTAEVQVMQGTMPIEDAPTSCVEARNRVRDWAGTLAGQDPRLRFYGLLEDPGYDTLTIEDDKGNPIGGCAQGQFGWGVIAPSGGDFGIKTAAHELGHMFGRQHVSGGQPDCELYSGYGIDYAYPHPGGLIGEAGAGDAQGIDTGDQTLGLGVQLFDWRDDWADIMSYCATKWISDWNYGFILGALCNQDQAGCPDHQALTGQRAISSARAASPAHRAAKGKGGPRLSVSATVARGSRRVKIESLAVRSDLALTGRSKKGRYAIVLRDSRGRVLRRYGLKPKLIGEDTARSIDAVVPFKGATRRITIVKGRKTVASQRVSAHAPTVDVVAPKKVKKHAKRVRLRWRSRDADGGKRTFSVLYTPDGKLFVPLAAGLRERSYKVDLTGLPGGRKARLEVIASDGVRTGADRSRPFKVRVKRPLVSILTPGGGSTLAADQPVQFVASVEDLQDVRFKRKNVVWESSQQGELGTGTGISASLTPGTHLITATATNSGGKSTAASVTVTAEAPPPVFTVEATGP